MLIDIIRTRTSVRKYLDRPIPRDDIVKCLEAARLAPSACNAQPWKFVVIDEPQLKEGLCNVAFSGAYFINSFAKGAPALIVVVSEKEKFLAAVGGYLKGTNYYLIDMGIACEHLILQAAELGIGSCWIGWFNEKAVKKLLDIPKQRKVDVIISLGYSKTGQIKHRDRKAIEEISSFNCYKIAD